MKFGIYRLMELLKCFVWLKRSLGFWIGHCKPDFNRLKTRCDKQFDTGPPLISAICKEAHLNGNSSAEWIGMVGAMSVHTENHSTGENKQPLIFCESPPESGESSQYGAPAALCWKSFVDLRRGVWAAQEKARETGGYKKEKKTPHTRTQDRRGLGDNSLSHASFLKLSRLFFSENGGGGREASTNPTFIYATRWEQFQWEFLMLFHVPWILLVVESLFSLNCSDLISICLKTGTHTQCDCKSSFT